MRLSTLPAVHRMQRGDHPLDNPVRRQSEIQRHRGAARHYRAWAEAQQHERPDLARVYRRIAIDFETAADLLEAEGA